jgi:hypothetical protein
MSTASELNQALRPVCHEIILGEQLGPVVTVADPLKPYTYEAMYKAKRRGTYVDCGAVVHMTDGAQSLQEDGESRARGRVLGPATLAEVSEAHRRSDKFHIPLATPRVWVKVAYD